jgi:hypothetical protein
MSAAVLLTWEVIIVSFTALHSRTVRAHGRFVDEVLLGHSSLRLPVMVISASIMVMIVAIGEALLRLVGVKPTPTPPPVESAKPPESDV